MTRRFPPSVGGMEKFAYDLYSSLSKKTNVHLIKWSGRSRYIPVILFPVFFIRASWILLTKPVEIIHMQDGVFSILGMFLKILFRKPLVVVIHGLDVTYKNKLYQYLNTKALNRADHIFSISNTAVNEVVNKEIPKANISFVPLGITDDLNKSDKQLSRSSVINELGLNKDAKIILSVGRLVKRKGIDWFIQNVLIEIVKVDKSIVFLISGEGPERESIQRTIDRIKLHSNIYMLGQTSDHFLAELYNGSDLFVMPNITIPGDMEGFGRVLLEASLCELPIVASSIEGITDAITYGKNGILVQPGHPEVFRDQIVSFLNNKNNAISFGKRSRQFTLQDFNWDKISDLYLTEYQKLLG